ncbi:bifunctional UDP-sugar hydrolase/5'-nucleotidase [Jannaschia sp. W003]|uniref:bifunctional metallophosphatase/5'-nucleotidase n=1 Tax=Jannaschia sp. W003 TaxID=2867012 RepID=UPI0021A931CD|nr:bifunctional metallophosphatase/5'-nucleotidase [Jannaschia sp. W003]UWQ20940.1 5'-nucleotidase/apyrase family protein [Jannaschia sp. W003]
MTRLLSSTAALLALSAGMAQAEFAMTILHTNDFHARFEPISKYDGPCAAEDNEAGECFGGTARLVNAVRDAKARAGENVLLVDGGDQFQGTLFYTQYKGAMSAEMMNMLGYDAMTVGNHEFDDGPEVLREFAETIEFPILMSNGDVTNEPLLSDVIEKSTVVEVGGEKVGLIGLTPQDTDELASPGPNVTFSDPSEAVQAEVDRLAEEGVNKIVVLSHSGYETDKTVAENTTGVDVIVGGHTNTLLGDMEGAEGPYPTMVGDTAIVQAYAYGKFLGELNVRFDDDGNVVEAAGQPLLIDAAVAEDEATVTRIRELAEPLEEIRNRVVATTAAPIGGDREFCRAQECEMGSLIADAMLDRVRDQGIDVAIQNGGGIRASIDAGEVTMGEVLTVLPFQNTLSTFRVDGATLKAALENGVSQVEEGAGRFAQVAGMTYSFDATAEPGSRITEVMIGGEPLDESATYGVVSNNYVRNGGDGYAMFVDAADAYDYGPDLADVTAEYLAAQGAEFEPYTDGRIAAN